MPRLSIDDLPKARRRFRPSRHQPGFETIAEARAEDALRAKRLRSRAVSKSPRVKAKSAKSLAHQLQRAARGGRVEDTLASSTNVRSIRQHLGGNLWRLVATTSLTCTTFTVLSRKWIYTPEQLRDVNPRRLLSGFRTDLNRAATGPIEGALIAILHGEFDQAGFFVLHLHGLALGDVVERLDSLRRLPKYKPSREGSSGEPAIKRPIQIRRKPLDTLPAPLTYLFKSYWSRKKRNCRHKRIKEPHHSEYLLWLSRQSLSDLTLLYGMYVDLNGFSIRSHG